MSKRKPWQIILDGTGLSRVERLKLVAEYNAKSRELSGGSLGRVDRLRAVKRLNEIRGMLGAGAGRTVDDGPEVATLRDVVAGKLDSLGLPELLDKIGTAIRALADAGKLADDVDTLGERAVEHWATLVPVAE